MSTRTYVTLDISQSAYDEIHAKLAAADYHHAFHDGLIDMHGIALCVEVPKPKPVEEEVGGIVFTKVESDKNVACPECHDRDSVQYHIKADKFVCGRCAHSGTVNEFRAAFYELIEKTEHVTLSG